MEVTKEIIQAVKVQVTERFPEMGNVEPEIEAKIIPSQPEIARKLGVPTIRPPGKQLYVCTFRKSVETEDGTKLTTIVKATVDEEGKVTKIISSKEI